MKERRKEQRKNLMAFTQVYDLYRGNLIGYLGDLTLMGAMAIGEKPPAENAELTIAIELPELKNINVLRIALPARVAWVKQDISPQFFNIGFEFKEVTPEQTKAIQAIIANYEFQRNIIPKYQTKPFDE
ncbi:MAG: PilZ domain-containing protein [Anaerolineales bacterium]|nr:PilZ domain-containing protein [Anaerolineales bacterium]